MKLEKREEILKQQEELFIKIDDLKQKKEELLEQAGEHNVQIEEVYQELNELKKQQEELEEKNPLQVKSK